MARGTAADVASAGRQARPARVRWYHSLRARLLLWTSLGMAGLLLGVTLLIYASARDLLVQQARTEIRGLAEQSTRTLHAKLNTVAVSAATLAASVRGIGANPDDLQALLRATVTGDADIAGAMLILGRDALADGDAEYSWYVRRQGAGFYEQSMRYRGYDYDVQPWWKRTIGAGQAWWSEPYRNAATGDAMFVTFNLPLRRDGGGRPVGMVSLDLPVRRLHALLGGQPRDGLIQRIVLSPERLYVMHPRADVELRQHLDDRLSEPGFEALLPLLAAAREHRPAEAIYVDPSTRLRRMAVMRPVPDSAWTLGLSVSEGFVLEGLQRITRQVIVGGLLAIGLMVLLLWVIARRITRPLAALTGSASQLAAGDFDAPLPHTGRRDEVGLMARAFDGARGSIKAQMAEIERMATARQRLDSELSIARDIQRAMLPPGRVLRSGTRQLQAHAVLEPAKAVGGDFYSFLERDGATLWFAIGDVSDKGVPAALFMARSVTVLDVAAGRGGSPAQTLRDAAARLAESNDACMFATVLCGVVDIDSGALALASAGHEPPLLCRADGSAELLALETGPPLGIEGDGAYALWRGQLQPGDALLAYTDGISEAFDDAQQAFGSERLLQAAAGGGDAAALCARVVAAVAAFVGDAAQSDDLTVLAISLATTSTPGD